MESIPVYHRKSQMSSLSSPYGRRVRVGAAAKTTRTESPYKEDNLVPSLLVFSRFKRNRREVFLSNKLVDAKVGNFRPDYSTMRVLTLKGFYLLCIRLPQLLLRQQNPLDRKAVHRFISRL
jgi:hypothetical protein